MFNQGKIIIPELDRAELAEYISLKEAQTVIFNDDVIKDLETPKFRKYVESEEFLAALTEFVALNYITKIIEFYRNQYYRRIDQKKTRFWDNVFDKTFMEARKESLNCSLSFDFFPISNLSKLDNEQLFAEKVVPDNLVTHYFLNTLNMLFVEMPGLYNDPRFVKRAEFILQNNILLLKDKESIYELDEDDEIDDDLMPRTKKLLKKIKRISR